MADYIIWSSDYSVGNNDIDRQHQRVIAIINAVYSLVKNSGEERKLWETLEDLKQYTIDHFEFEERILTQVEYPDLKTHALIHAKMKARTTALSAKQNERFSGIVAQEALEMLKDWWLNHIRILDAQYVPYLNASDMQM